MQSAMRMFVARFASKDPRIRGGTNAGVLQLRFRMTAKSKSKSKSKDKNKSRFPAGMTTRTAITKITTKNKN
jgi:hypothetical protein